MELTTNQKIVIKKFAIEMATRVASMSPGRLIQFNPDKDKIKDFDYEAFMGAMKSQPMITEFKASPAEVTLVDQIKADAQKIYDWITQEEVRVLEKGIHY
jgi:hypothetical protein